MWRLHVSHELVILSYATVCLHPSVSLNNEKNRRKISKDKIAVCKKTVGLRSGDSSDLNSACLKALVLVEIFQFSDMHYESRFLDTIRGHNIRPRRQKNLRIQIRPKNGKILETRITFFIEKIHGIASLIIRGRRDEILSCSSFAIIIAFEMGCVQGL